MITLVSVNAGTTIQDLGRPGWKRFGVPVGGAMDETSARFANLLVGNAETEPVLEILLGHATLRTETHLTFALTGAEPACDFAPWRSHAVPPGTPIALHGARSGVWTYLAVSGGFASSHFFGSASMNPRAGLGNPLLDGGSLFLGKPVRARGIGSRFLPEHEWPAFDSPLAVPLWPGPEWELLSASDQARFQSESWTVSSRSDRTGYRLEGPAIGSQLHGILSSPVTIGTVQLPPGGNPIIVMRDGPTVGGYPRLGSIDPDALSAVTQQRPGATLQFQLIT